MLLNLLGGDRKKIVSVIVGGVQPSYVGRENGAMEGEYKTPSGELMEAKKEAASALIEAVKGGDAEAVVRCFEDLKELCEGNGDDMGSCGGDLYETGF